MHAKKTRDRKKQFLEMSENIIAEMEAEAKAMRSYLLSLNLISEEDCALSLRREMESKEEIAKLKVLRCFELIETTMIDKVGNVIYPEDHNRGGRPSRF